MIKTLLIIFLVFASTPIKANPIIADLAIRTVDIDHNFDGLDILMFGAQNSAGRIIVTLKGPKKTYIVRKKENIGGIWVNNKSITFQNVNNFYAVAATHKFNEIRNDNLLNNFEIGLDNLEIIPTDPSINENIATINEFREALISSKISDNLYSDHVEDISFWGEILFRTTLKFPKNIERGWYTAQTYLFSNGILTATQSTPIHVSKIGLEAYIFDAAHNHAFLYGIICVAIALIAGWSANTLFKRV